MCCPVQECNDTDNEVQATSLHRNISVNMAIEKVIGIVTDVIKYSDKKNIITLFAREQGRVSLLSATGNGKTARLRNASLMPLSLITADINFNAMRELQFLGRFSRPVLWKDIYFNPVKSAVAMFVSEFLNIYIRQSPPDPRLFDFVVEAISLLDRTDRVIANFHLAFLIQFLSYAGIFPDLSGWREDAFFDMQGGEMTVLHPPHAEVLKPSQARMLPLISRMNLHNSSRFRFSVGQRRELMRGLLRYYSLHFSGMSNLKSPQVLTEVFE